ncbi:MAG: heme ABC exporter ATP-binding protein CcmA [Pseudomonadota bacterium]
MQGSGPASLSARDLACRRGDRLLFRGLSFDLGAGEALHVTGANGSGKTTLIRALAGLMTPLAGDVSHKGAIGLADERLALDPDKPLEKALGFWFGVDNTANSKGIMASMRLGELAEVPVRYLSTGQRKRAGLARLIGQNAPIWLLDEPLSGLDTASQDMVIALLSEHCAKGGIAFIASHQPLAIPGLQTLAIEDFAPAPERME